MDIFSRLLIQFKKIHKLILFVYVSPIIFLMIVTIGAIFKHKPLGFYMRDPSATAQMSPYAGLVSNVGVLVWAAGASICFFTALILNYTSNKSSQQRQINSFFLLAGSLTTLLLLDDFFLIHDHLLFHLHIGEKITYSIYLTLLILFLVKFRSHILQTSCLFLITALGFFGLSILIDVVQPVIEDILGENLRILIEDGAKLMGITGWSTYFIKCAVDEISSIIQG